MLDYYPRVLVNQAICQKNIRSMVQKCRDQDISFRPHFKTHQSAAIGKWFLEEGVNGITVSSLKMARYFADNGWNDIFIAFPVNLLEVDGINRLAKRITLSISIESEESARFMDQRLAVSTGVYLKIDTGYHRTGIDSADYKKVDHLLSIIDRSSVMTFKGFYTHAGHTYHARKKQEIIDIATSSIGQLIALKERFSIRFPALDLSYGDTPSCSIHEDFKGLDELRPGNFIFYDLMQERLGSCTIKDIGMAIECPVVARNESRMEILVHGGAVHLSKEFQVLENEPCYGLVAPITEDGWGTPFQHTWVTRLSQEHGIIRTDPITFNSIRIGDTLAVLPVHSCLTANLAEQYLTTDGKLLTKIRS